MKHSGKHIWSDDTVSPLPQPKRQQVAALCYKETPEGRRVLLITSRDTGRWIVPKGWPIDGLKGFEAALQEAWEEAGVRNADIEETPLGTYDYNKVKNKGPDVPVRAKVYLARVRELSEEYPEMDQRKRAWFSAKAASELVDEPELRQILRDF